MSTLARATIKSYDATTHSAAVQIAGSLAVWLDSVPVSDGIAPADVVAGRECGVIFFAEDNPSDAAIVTVHNAVPTGWPGATKHVVQDADANTYVDTERNANEDKVRLAVGGTLRYLLQTASPHHQLTGDLSMLAGSVVIGNAGATVQAGTFVLVDDHGAGADQTMGLGVFLGQSWSLSTNALYGVAGKALNKTDTTIAVYGLDFAAGCTGAIFTGGKTQVGCRVTLTHSSSATGSASIDSTGFQASFSVTGSNFTGITLTAFAAGTASNAKVSAWTGLALATAGSFNAATAVRPLAVGGVARTADTDGSYHRMNFQFGSASPAFGTGDGVIGLAYATTNPSTNPAGGVVIYADANTGDFKVRGAAGQVCKLPTGGAINVTGARGGNAALANLLTALAGLGLIVDSTT